MFEGIRGVFDKYAKKDRSKNLNQAVDKKNASQTEVHEDVEETIEGKQNQIRNLESQIAELNAELRRYRNSPEQYGAQETYDAQGIRKNNIARGEGRAAGRNRVEADFAERKAKLNAQIEKIQDEIAQMQLAEKEKVLAEASRKRKEIETRLMKVERKRLIEAQAEEKRAVNEYVQEIEGAKKAQEKSELTIVEGLKKKLDDLDAQENNLKSGKAPDGGEFNDSAAYDILSGAFNDNYHGEQAVARARTKLLEDIGRQRDKLNRQLDSANKIGAAETEAAEAEDKYQKMKETSREEFARIADARTPLVSEEVKLSALVDQVNADMEGNPLDSESVPADIRSEVAEVQEKLTEGIKTEKLLLSGKDPSLDRFRYDKDGIKLPTFYAEKAVEAEISKRRVRLAKERKALLEQRAKLIKSAQEAVANKIAVLNEQEEHVVAKLNAAANNFDGKNQAAAVMRAEAEAKLHVANQRVNEAGNRAVAAMNRTKAIAADIRAVFAELDAARAEEENARQAVEKQAQIVVEEDTDSSIAAAEVASVSADTLISASRRTQEIQRPTEKPKRNFFSRMLGRRER